MAHQVDLSGKTTLPERRQERENSLLLKISVLVFVLLFGEGTYRAVDRIMGSEPITIERASIRAIGMLFSLCWIYYFARSSVRQEEPLPNPPPDESPLVEAEPVDRELLIIPGKFHHKVVDYSIDFDCAFQESVVDLWQLPPPSDPIGIGDSATIFDYRCQEPVVRIFDITHSFQVEEISRKISPLNPDLMFKIQKDFPSPLPCPYFEINSLRMYRQNPATNSLMLLEQHQM